MFRTSFIIIIFLFLLGCAKKDNLTEVLVFTKTAEFRHESIEHGVAILDSLGKANGIVMVHEENSEIFMHDDLNRYAAIVFLNTTGNILTNEQQTGFEHFYKQGKGFVGIHAASDTEYDWSWYGNLVGAYFDGHPNNPNVREAEMDVLDVNHLSCKHLPSKLKLVDEWYNFREIVPEIKVLINLDETSYEGGTNGESHPISWYREFDGGRSFYTGFGHTKAAFNNPKVQKHLLGGIKYAIGKE